MVRVETTGVVAGVKNMMFTGRGLSMVETAGYSMDILSFIPDPYLSVSMFSYLTLPLDAFIFRKIRLKPGS